MSETFNAQASADHLEQGSATPGVAGDHGRAGIRDTVHDVTDKAQDVATHLRARVGDRARSVRSAATDLDVEQLVQQHPWMAVAGALAVGAFLGTGGGARAAGATAGLAAGAGRGAAGLASRASHAVSDSATGLAHRVVDATPPQMKSAFSSARHEVGDTVGDAIAQLKGSVSEVLHARIDEFVGELRKGIEELGGRSQNA